jgi:hypothetical protein
MQTVEVTFTLGLCLIFGNLKYKIGIEIQFESLNLEIEKKE